MGREKVNLMWMDFWPRRYPWTRGDVVLSAVRCGTPLVMCWVGWRAGPLLFGLEGGSWARAAGHVGGVLFAMVLAIAVDTAARDQGERVALWRRAEHEGRQADARRSDAGEVRAAQLEPGAVPAPRAPQRHRQPVPAGRAEAVPAPAPPAGAGAVFDLAELVYATVSGVQWNAGLTATELLDKIREYGYEVPEHRRLQLVLWELTALRNWLAVDQSGASPVFTARHIRRSGDPWPGLGDVTVTFCQRAGADGLPFVALLERFTERDVQIDPNLVRGAVARLVDAGRLAWQIRDRRRYLVIPDVTQGGGTA